MSSIMRPLSVVVCCLSLSLFGFGCKQPSGTVVPTNWRGVIGDKDEQVDTKVLKTKPSKAKLIEKPEIEKRVAPEVSVLRQAYQALAQANTFRAHIKIPAAGGQQAGSGELIYVRNEGVWGSINAGQEHSEIVSRFGQVFLKHNTSTWQLITQSEDGQKFLLFLSLALPGKGRLTPTLVSDSASIIERADDPRGCIRYTYTEVVPSGELEKTIICIKDQLPLSVVNIFAEGRTETTYSDINAPLTLPD